MKELCISILRKKRLALLGSALLLPVLLLAATRFKIAATDVQIKELLNALEVFYSFFASLFICCILPRKTEAELIVLSGNSLIIATLWEFLAFFGIALVSGEVAGMFLLPAWANLQFALSFPVTLLCLFALALFVRFAVDNVFANLGVHTGLFMLLFLTSGMGPETPVTRALTRIDLFVNGYAHLLYSDAAGYWYLRFGDVLRNRLLFLLIGALIFGFAILLSKQTRLYNVKR